jgi:pilus assembly protein CpaB
MEVTSPQAQQVAVATRLGRLSLAVRSADHAPTPVDTAKKITWSSDVSPALGTNVAQGAHSELHVFHGAAEGKEEQF